jgi:hypothetical protein
VRAQPAAMSSPTTVLLTAALPPKMGPPPKRTIKHAHPGESPLVTAWRELFPGRFALLR